MEGGVGEAGVGIITPTPYRTIPIESGAKADRA
ncbi:MAG: hypothetical protein ACI95C_001941 [Pseudohongiellaceae bacterium]|jgi:hypothetical protein